MGRTGMCGWGYRDQCARPPTHVYHGVLVRPTAQRCRTSHGGPLGASTQSRFGKKRILQGQRPRMVEGNTHYHHDMDHNGYDRCYAAHNEDAACNKADRRRETKRRGECNSRRRGGAHGTVTATSRSGLSCQTKWSSGWNHRNRKAACGFKRHSRTCHLEELKARALHN